MASEPQAAPHAGWHWVEWGCEFLGTALLLVGGLSAVCLTMGTSVRTDIPSLSLRLLLTGTLFAGTGALMAISPWGRRSGAHLNPAVTLAFWLQRKVGAHDLVGYIAAQALGGVAGALVVLGLWRGTARGVSLGATAPGRGLGDLGAMGVETLMTAALVLTILLFTSSARTARWTPVAVLVLVASLVCGVAPYTGTSLNPARSLGPALLAPLLEPYWVYVVGPLAGALLACAIFYPIKSRQTMTAKLFHDPGYRSTMASTLPVAPSSAERRAAAGAPQSSP